MPHYLTDEAILDYISEPTRLVEHIPRLVTRFDALADLRGEVEHQTPTWARGGMRRVASMPSALLNAILLIKPNFLSNKTVFFKWLDKHPEYETKRRRRA